MCSVRPPEAGPVTSPQAAPHRWAQPPSPEWGSILASGRNYISRAPWILIFPGLAICLTVLSFNLIGDGIRDLTDPKSRRRRS